MKKEIVEVKDQLPALNQAEQQAMYGDIEREDLKIPRLSILESMSPEVADSLGKPGDFFVKGLNLNLGSNPVEVVVLMRSKSRMRWAPLDDGGGILCQADDGKNGVGEPGGSCQDCDLKNWKGREQPLCDLYENFIVMVRGVELALPVALSGSRSRLSGLRDLNTMLELHRLQQRPFYDKAYQIRAVKKQNPNVKGSNYHVFGFFPGNKNEIIPLEEQRMYSEMFKAFSRLNVKIERDIEAKPATASDGPSI